MIDPATATDGYDGEDEDEDDGPPPFEAGHHLTPDYRILAMIRRGNDLDVYDVWSEERAARCIVKTLRPDRLKTASAKRRLLREGELLQRLTHPHIVRGYETLTDPQPMVVLETLGGQTLSHLIETAERDLQEMEIAYLGMHLCSAAHYLHRQNIIHLDFKPSNVIANAGIAKVLDLSIAREPGKVRRGTGSYGFMSPEQVKGGQIGPKTDVFGIGTVLFTAVTGEIPYDADETFTVEPQIETPHTPLRELRQIQEPFAAIIDACLATDPDQRPTIAELTRALAAFTPEQPLV